MRYLNGVYTRRYNGLHNYDGQLFRGRYKSVPVAEESHLLELVRYIHRNPVRAGIVETVCKYPWNTHQGYLSASDEWVWLHKNFILAAFAEDRGEQGEAYRKFVPEEDSEALLDRFVQKKWPTHFLVIKALSPG